MKPNVFRIKDNELTRYRITFQPEKQGWTLSATLDGPVASQRSRRPSHLFSLLLDIQLPGLDGYVVARLLRIHPISAALPSITVPAYAMVNDRQHTLAAGCSGYPERPVNPETRVDCHPRTPSVRPQA
ncbi:MAG: response regulator [Chromatiaceae bacterium]